MALMKTIFYFVLFGAPPMIVMRLKTTKSACPGIVLGFSTWVVFVLANTAPAVGDLLPEVTAQLEKQKDSLRILYVEFTQTSRGSLPNWDYDPAPAVSAYFDGNHFYRHERIPRYEQELHQAFDGQTFWRGDLHLFTGTALEDSANLSQFQIVKWEWFDAAGICAPKYAADLSQFSSLKPIALYYVECKYKSEVEAVGETLRVTFQVTDELARLQNAQLEQGAAAKSKHAVPPKRTVELSLDPKRGFATTAQRMWNVAGQLTADIRCDDWRFYEERGIWLPGRCVASYYARPTLFVSDVSDVPVHIVTTELKTIEFGKKDIAFSLGDLDSRVESAHPVPPTATTHDTIPRDPHENVDLATIERIKAEAAKNSQVMEIVSWLTDVYGARLTGSPATKAAGLWAIAKLESWGVSNAHLERWGPFAPGWTSEKFALIATSPSPFVINAVPAVYSPSTNGRIWGPAIRLDVRSFADMQRRFEGKLKGGILLVDPPQATPAHFKPQASRLTDERLQMLAAGQSLPRAPKFVDTTYDPILDAEWLATEGVAALLFSAPGDGGTIFQWGRGASVVPKKGDPHQLPMVKVSAESYGRIVRVLEKSIPVILELEMRNTFDWDPEVFNVIAEIPGTDPVIKDETVLIGAHLDSWTYGTGATDNAAGVAVMMEAIRILKALDLRPRRNIRIALWTGEEQGALGSTAYIGQHFKKSTVAADDSETVHSPNEDFSVYFNLDGGTGKIRGVLNAHDSAIHPVFQAWMGPFKGLGMQTVSPVDIGGGDQRAFQLAGLASFGFIQDPVEYDTRTHHSSADVYERIQAEDLRFNAAVLASFAWQAAQRDEKLSR
jgi:hypothetical protein